MIAETQTTLIVLQLDNKLHAQLQPFLAGLDITATATHCLTMRSEVYEALIKRVGSALDYEIRWQPNEYEPDGFVERVCPLELNPGILAAAEGSP